MKNVASFTWEHKGNVALGRKAARFPADEFLDATNHDWHISPVFLYEFAHAIGRKLGWAWAGHFLMTLRQAQLIKPDKLGEGGAKLEGDPFDLKTFRAYYGNPSGIPLTSVIAYLAGTWYGLSALVLAGHLKSDKRSLQALLNGTHPTWALLNAGDNLAVLGPSDSAVTELADLITFAELGTTDSFLGSLPIRRNGEIRFVPNITSYVNNLLMPGRSLSDPQRGDPVVGAAARRQIFSAAPAFEQVDAILQKVLKTTTGIDYAALQDAGETRVRSMNFVRAMLDYNRDAFHFKLDPLDVPADILEDYFILIPEEVSRDIAQHYDRAHEGRWQRLFSDITEDYGVHHVHN